MRLKFSPIKQHLNKVKSWNPVKSSDEDYFDYIDLSSIDKDRKEILLSSVPKISPSDAPSRARQLVEVNDVLVATVRPNLNGVALVPSSLNGATASTGYCVLRANAQTLDSKYLFYWVQSPSFVSDMMSKATGATYPAVSDKIICENEIPLPPLPEQQRIAAILDKADAIRRKRQQAIELADEFLRAVFLDMFGDPVTNPKGWEIVELAALIDEKDKLNYGVVQPGDAAPDGIPLIRSGDLSDYTPLLNSIRRVSEEIDYKHRKSRLKGNEILIACVGSIGKVGWVTEEMKGWNIARAVTRIPLKKSVNREYIYRYLQSPVVQGYFEKETRAVAQPTLNVSLIAKTPIALPPKELQQEFLRKYANIIAFKSKLINASLQDSKLFESLSQRAFAGEL